MPVIHNITQLSELSRIIKSKSGYSMTIGVFDGIHLGHKFLIKDGFSNDWNILNRNATFFSNYMID